MRQCRLSIAACLALGMVSSGAAEARPGGSAPGSGFGHHPGFHHPGFHAPRPHGILRHGLGRRGAWNGPWSNAWRHRRVGYRGYAAGFYGWGWPGTWPGAWPIDTGYPAPAEAMPQPETSVPLPEVPGIAPSPVGAPAIYIIQPAGTRKAGRSAAPKVVTVPSGTQASPRAGMRVANDDPSDGPRIIHVTVPAGR